jgi:hypothetical protein
MQEEAASMARIAKLPDGTTLEFDDLTDDKVMDAVVRKHLAEMGLPGDEVARQEDVRLETAKVQTLAEIGVRLDGLLQAQEALIQAVAQLAEVSARTSEAVGQVAEGLASMRDEMAGVGRQVVAAMTAPKKVRLADGTTGSIAPDVSKAENV